MPKMDNRVALLEMVKQIFEVGPSLTRLSLNSTDTGGDIGKEVLEALAESDIVTLEDVDITGNVNWFRTPEARGNADLLARIVAR